MLAIATAALLVLETTAATMMYDYSGHESYKHEDHYSVIDVKFLGNVSLKGSRWLSKLQARIRL